MKVGDIRTRKRFLWLPGRVGTVSEKHRKWKWWIWVEDTYIWANWPYDGYWLLVGTGEVIDEEVQP